MPGYSSQRKESCKSSHSPETREGTEPVAQRRLSQTAIHPVPHPQTFSVTGETKEISLSTMKGAGCIFVLLLVHAVTMEEFYVIVPDFPVVATVGEDAVLECQKIPNTSLDALEVRWFTTSSGSPVHLYTNGQHRAEVQDGAYRGRTELFREEFPRGNASLKLKRVKVSDAGIYTCSISTPTSRQQEELRLQVEGFGLRPWIRFEESTTQGVRVVCMSDGWFPKPEIRWLDGSGQDVTARSDILFTKDSSGLFTVHSHIDVTSDSVNRYSCYIRSKRLRKTREAHLQISDMFINKVNEFNIWLPIFCVFAGFVITAAALNVMIHRHEDKKIQGYDDTDIEYVSVTLDVDTAHPRLVVAEDGQSVKNIGTERNLPDNGKRFTYWSSLLGSVGFTSGRRYWEVEVAENRGWCLGVAAESVERKRSERLTTESRAWSLERSGDRFYVNTSPESNLTARPIPRKVGVYLSYESGKVSFYDADSKSFLYSFTGNAFTEKLYPFFATWDINHPLIICQEPLSALK
ncbi:butyrophilin subfamily 1 member A1-like isoform X2 [Leucoraja erinacea]|uniref:butyrophilin subfamily 1 member A1-like isoform X2 n=1 Tax=Leucoraja erinaceus TaxID=7782 RepID=UPI002457A1C3|nr:butyrophilin subfamily 1 member A1-like isoform X2 [Leucoraja erinacea]